MALSKGSQGSLLEIFLIVFYVFPKHFLRIQERRFEKITQTMIISHNTVLKISNLLPKKLITLTTMNHSSTLVINKGQVGHVLYLIH